MLTQYRLGAPVPVKRTFATKWRLYHETCVSDYSVWCRIWYLLGVEKAWTTPFLVPLRGQNKNSRRASPTFSYGSPPRGSSVLFLNGDLHDFAVPSLQLKVTLSCKVWDGQNVDLAEPYTPPYSTILYNHLNCECACLEDSEWCIDPPANPLDIWVGLNGLFISSLAIILRVSKCLQREERK